MAGDNEPRAASFGRRLQKWVRDSAELRSLWDAAHLPTTPEEATVRRYRRSRTLEVALPHPAISQRRYDVLTEHQQAAARRVMLASLLVPLLVVLGVVVGPLAAQVAIWALLVPTAGVLAHQGRALSRIDAERRLAMSGGLADAWSDWVTAREQLEALEGAAQARAALAANEGRMHSLVLALARSQTDQETAEHAASREWVYRSAAKAMALAEAEQELEAATQRHVDAGDLQLAPEGDLDALDHAVDTARELTRRADEPPSLEG